MYQCNAWYSSHLEELPPKSSKQEKYSPLPNICPLFNKWGFCVGEGLGPNALPCFEVPKHKGDNPSVGHPKKNLKKWRRAPLPFFDIKTCPNCPNCEVQFRMCNIFVEKFEISGKCLNYLIVNGQRFFFNQG